MHGDDQDEQPIDATRNTTTLMKNHRFLDIVLVDVAVIHPHRHLEESERPHGDAHEAGCVVPHDAHRTAASQDDRAKRQKVKPQLRENPAADEDES